MKLGGQVDTSVVNPGQFLIPGIFSLCATYSSAIDFVGIFEIPKNGKTSQSHTGGSPRTARLAIVSVGTARSVPRIRWWILKKTRAYATNLKYGKTPGCPKNRNSGVNFVVDVLARPQFFELVDFDQLWSVMRPKTNDS